MLVSCKYCTKEFNKSQGQINKSTTGNHFCTRSCSASYNNKKNPRRTKTKKCKFCETLVLSSRQRCDKCIKNQSLEDISLKEAIYYKHHKSSAFALVRSRARSIAKKLGWTSCKNCNYDKHIEVCHIKPISEYPLETLISKINHESNLIPLCPNCHWEFDHDLLNL